MTQTITMISDAATQPLDPALCAAVRNAWGGGDILWLAPDEAAEFPVARRPGNFAEIWSDCQALGVDLTCQPTHERRKKMLLADMDSTLIQQECIDELAAEAGLGPRVADITARAMNGELEFEAALEARVSLLRGFSEGLIDTVLANRITFTPGGRVLAETMRANGAFCMVISGGFTAFTEHVARTLGFDKHRANTLRVEDGVLTGDVGRPILGRNAKVAAMREETARLGLSPAEVIAVGDGANDLGMLRLAGTGVALHAKPAVQAECDIRINHGDLAALLFLQGYSRDEFVQV